MNVIKIFIRLVKLSYKIYRCKNKKRKKIKMREDFINQNEILIIYKIIRWMIIIIMNLLRFNNKKGGGRIQKIHRTSNTTWNY